MTKHKPHIFCPGCNKNRTKACFDKNMFMCKTCANKLVENLQVQGSCSALTSRRYLFRSNWDFKKALQCIRDEVANELKKFASVV